MQCNKIRDKVKPAIMSPSTIIAQLPDAINIFSDWRALSAFAQDGGRFSFRLLLFALTNGEITAIPRELPNEDDRFRYYRC